MQFRPISSYAAPALAPASPLMAAPVLAAPAAAVPAAPALNPLAAAADGPAMAPVAPAQAAAAAPAGSGAGQSPVANTLQGTSENLLKQIPGEATGFYLLAAGAFAKPNLWTLGIIFVLALTLLVMVRWLAHASRAIMTTTIIAFLLWMLILDNGFIHALFPNALIPPWGFIIVTFYTIAVALLANAGKIK
jgi:hypothetical protein